MKRLLGIVIVVAVLLAIPSYAFLMRNIDVYPDITFSGSEAICSVCIYGDLMTDQISATMVLKRGNTLIGSWSANDVGILEMEEFATVSRNKTYTLTVNYSVNGITQDPVTISRTN